MGAWLGDAGVSWCVIQKTAGLLLTSGSGVQLFSKISQLSKSARIRETGQVGLGLVFGREITIVWAET